MASDATSLPDTLVHPPGKRGPTMRSISNRAAGDLASASSLLGPLRAFTKRYRWHLVLTYGLFNAENVVRLLQPLMLGLAINDLLAGGYRGLLLFVIMHIAHMSLRLARQMLDTRIFTAIYTGAASQVVATQRERAVSPSRVAARSAMSRQYTDFLERHVPMLMRSAYSVAGALLMLSWFDPWLASGCLLLALPTAYLNLRFGRHALQLNRALHDQMEREVDVIKDADPAAVQAHYQSLAQNQVRLSDCEAVTTGTTEIFVLLLLASALLRVCTTSGVQPGDIYAVFRYVLMFIMGLDAVPMLVQQVSRLRDIGRRLVA